MADLKLVSAFAGVGGFDLAFQRAGVEAIAQIEIDAKARGVLREHWSDVTQFSDILEVGSDDVRTTGFVPQRGVLAGGFPCQDLSIAGRRAGMDRGTRSGLFWELDRLIEGLSPKWVVFENVPGLLSSNDGRDLGTVFRALAQRGYGFAYRVLDAQDFGVPQRRRRIFIVGRRGDDGSGPASVLFDGTGGVGDLAESPEAWARTAGAPSVRAGSDREGGPASGDVTTFRKSRRAANAEDYETWVPSDQTNTLNTFDNAGDIRATELVVRRIAATLTTGYGEQAPQDLYNQLMTQGLPPDGSPVRRLTPRECERLQGFPDDWTRYRDGIEQSDSVRYRQMGNSLAVPVVEWIAKRLVIVDQSLEGELICFECGGDTVTVGYAYCMDCLEGGADA